MAVVLGLDEVIGQIEWAGADGEDRGIAGAEFFDVGLDFVIQQAGGHKRDGEELAVGQGDGAVLHLASRVPLGVEVADLLELEGSFECEREKEVTPDKKETVPVEVAFAEPMDPVVEGIGDDEGFGGVEHRIEFFPEAIGFDGVALLGDPEGEHPQHHRLGGKCLGAGDPFFDPGAGKEGGVALADDGGVIDVADTEAAQPGTFGHLERFEGVGRLAALGDGDEKGVVC